MKQARVAVVGAGAMGLAAAYHAAKAGHVVNLYEAGPEPGGMAAHFDFDGLSIERFYHFVCKADRPPSSFSRSSASATRCAGVPLRWAISSTGDCIHGAIRSRSCAFPRSIFPPSCATAC